MYVGENLLLKVHINYLQIMMNLYKTFLNKTVKINILKVRDNYSLLIIISILHVYNLLQ